MTALRILPVRVISLAGSALRFDGSSVQAMAILDWVREDDISAKGHYRQGVGIESDAIFIPLPTGQVLRLDHGSYLVRFAPRQFAAYSAEDFASQFEIIP